MHAVVNWHECAGWLLEGHAKELDVDSQGKVWDEQLGEESILDGHRRRELPGTQMQREQEGCRTPKKPPGRRGGTILLQTAWDTGEGTKPPTIY